MSYYVLLLCSEKSGELLVTNGITLLAKKHEFSRLVSTHFHEE